MIRSAVSIQCRLTTDRPTGNFLSRPLWECTPQFSGYTATMPSVGDLYNYALFLYFLYGYVRPDTSPLLVQHPPPTSQMLENTLQAERQTDAGPQMIRCCSIASRAWWTPVFVVTWSDEVFTLQPRSSETVCAHPGRPCPPSPLKNQPLPAGLRHLRTGV